MKRVLAIDTCGSEGSVQLFDSTSGHVLGEATLPGRETQEKLLPAVESVLAGAGCAPSGLSTLAVVSGPGSFTGVRIGLAAVKGLAEALDLPVVAVSRLVVLANSLSAHGPAYVYALLDAGRGEVYCAAQGRESISPAAPVLARVREGDVVAVLEPALLERFPGAVLVSFSEYQRSFRTEVQRAIDAGEYADVVLLDANYLRKPDAELARNARVTAELFTAANHAGQKT